MTDQAGRVGDMGDATKREGLSAPSVDVAVFDPWQRQSVLTSLRLCASWSLPARQWSEFNAVLDELFVALAEGDTDSFGAVCADLIDLAPSRATRLGDEPAFPPPEVVRERINELVHVLVELPEVGQTTALAEDWSRHPSAKAE